VARKSSQACAVSNLATFSPTFAKQKWQRFRIKDGEKGPMVWEAKRIELWIKDEHKLPVGPYHLVIARPVLNTAEVKYFLSNGPMDTTLEVLLLVAFSRWRIERMFEDSKTELGMDHFEVRKYLSIQRHMILTCVSHLFLTEFWLTHRDKKNGTHSLPGPNRHARPGAGVVPSWSLFQEAGRSHRHAIGVNAAAQSQRSS